MVIKIRIRLDMNGLKNLSSILPVYALNLRSILLSSIFQEDLGESYPPYLGSKPRKRKETKDSVIRVETREF